MPETPFALPPKYTFKYLAAMHSAPPDGFSLQPLPYQWNASELFKNINELHFIPIEDIEREITIYDIRTLSIRTSLRRLNDPNNCCDTVFRPPQPLSMDTKRHRRESLEVLCSLDEDTLDEISRRTTLLDLYPLGLWEGDLHLIECSDEASVHASEEQDTVSDLSVTEHHRIFFKKAPKKAPSSEAKKGAALEKTVNQQLAGRRISNVPANTAPPSLYDETLCQLRHDIHHTIPLNQDYAVFYRLRKAMIQPYKTESERKTAFNNVAMEFLGHRPNGWTIGEYHTDSALLVQIPPHNFPYVIEEVKKEIGSAVAEPGLQSALYYLEYLRQMVADGEYSHCAFPIILLLQFGPYLSVLVGTAAGPQGQPAAEQIACIALHAHQTNQNEIDAGARIVAGLRIACHSLRERYPALVQDTGFQVQFPYPRTFFSDKDGSQVAFTYVSGEPDKRVYHARRDDTKAPICIKFSLRYSQDAHGATFNAGYAPELLAVKNVGDWFMIVMDDVSGEYTTLEALKSQGGVDLAAIRDHMQKGLDILHKEYVHGDVRAVNLLVRNADIENGARLGERSVLLVDWDWGGRIGEACYPHNINPDIARAKGATAGAEIQPAHDIWMLKTATGLMLKDEPS
ncbi:hypothetical protein BDN71DRAFT_1594137 [Pleurotus eryngii]|uniref:Uncharacterized protein n=1 Tax=Pleurotus eryngii TaxID=5323 RepID=A0A9P6D9U9_PLEER|nr:hypothetical protein BDN71DRAFT_1594137 [Pleurotus eryngii]